MEAANRIRPTAKPRRLAATNTDVLTAVAGMASANAQLTQHVLQLRLCVARITLARTQLINVTMAPLFFANHTRCVAPPVAVQILQYCALRLSPALARTSVASTEPAGKLVSRIMENNL
eukprot:10297250-Prorocentrum_lima.AAC.1